MQTNARRWSSCSPSCGDGRVKNPIFRRVTMNTEPRKCCGRREIQHECQYAAGNQRGPKPMPARSIGGTNRNIAITAEHTKGRFADLADTQAAALPSGAVVRVLSVGNGNTRHHSRTQSRFSSDVEGGHRRSILYHPRRRGASANHALVYDDPSHGPFRDLVPSNPDRPGRLRHAFGLLFEIVLIAGALAAAARVRSAAERFAADSERETFPPPVRARVK
jgi:hypothetical protein